ncbi:MAG TPA: cytochrome c oxidase subunit 3 [Kouleothrix sp.]|uniref:cytochrome c oxidase subunit 3 n=1 Tax=Kouleothrix sp. TaxID=2779161 RepID=UPI002BC9F05B|nr:cytochrome c oxidase subunit 3 [Kouleothrix sp.]
MSQISTTSSHSAASHGVQADHATSMHVDSRKLGVWAFIGSEVMFFAALITVYLVYKPRNLAAGGPDPKEVLGIGVTSALAAILLASSVTMVLALAAARRGDRRQFTIWMLSTAGLGLCFLGGQAYEFTELIVGEGITMPTSLFGQTFFILTGFHGTHVAIGVIWLLATFFKVRAYPKSRENVMDIELAGLYWHFVDLVWVGIFTIIYLMPDFAPEAALVLFRHAGG